MSKYINKSTLFLPTMLGYSRSNLGNEFKGCFINKEDNIIFLFSLDCFNDSKIIKKEFKDEGIAYYFEIPETFKKDFDLFKQSKYSKFSMDYIIKLIETEGNDTLAVKVITKSPDRRKYVEENIGMQLPSDAEVLSALDLSEEIIS